MEIVYTHCCGMDVHKKSVTACLITPKGKEIKTFSTMTDDLLKMLDWLMKEGCQQVAMESTASYWKPVYNLLEAAGMPTMIVNAKHIKNVPGRKTDVKDAEWIADLLRHGLLKESFIPSQEQRELRELIRYRHSLIQERAREINRLQKVLEGANIKLSSVVSDILGKSSRAMLEALIQGEEDPEKLSELAQKRLKSKKGELQKALKGLMGPHQKLMIEIMLEHIDSLTAKVKQIDEEVEKRMDPFFEIVVLLETIPGVGRRTAEQILAELGTDMGRFPTASHLCSWAGVAPGNNESAGKRKSGKTRKGNKKLRAALVEAARAAARTKGTYLSSKYQRLAARRGAKRAAIAIAHQILKISYYIIKEKQPYIELGPDHYEKTRRERTARSSIKKLESLGYKVSVEETA